MSNPQTLKPLGTCGFHKEAACVVKDARLEDDCVNKFGGDDIHVIAISLGDRT